MISRGAKNHRMPFPHDRFVIGRPAESISKPICNTIHDNSNHDFICNNLNCINSKLH